MQQFGLLLVYFALLFTFVRSEVDQVECERRGYIADESKNCEVYYYCVENEDHSFYAIRYECPQGEEFSLARLKCVPGEDHECSGIPNDVWYDETFEEEFMCPSAGRFPDIKSEDCKSFYMCASDMVPALSNCPSKTIFSWVEKKCVPPTAFTCPNGVVTTTTTEPITTTTTATTETTESMTSTTTESTSFVCTSSGRFPDPQSLDCKRFYLCTATVDGDLTTALSRCPSTTVFSPDAKKCVPASQYTCPEITTAPTVDSTTTEGTTEMVTTEMITTTSESTTTTITEMDTTIISTTEDIFETTSSVTNEGTTEDKIESTASTVTEIPPTTPQTEVPFLCTGVGRFPNPESENCKSFYLCMTTVDGDLGVTLSLCPSNTVFSPDAKKCVPPSQYKCPTVAVTPNEIPSSTSSVNPSTVESTTEELTTDEASTTVMPPQESTTDESTTEKSTSEESTTEELTTQETTTQEPTTTVQNTVELTSTSKPTTAEPTTIEQTTMEITTLKPTTAESTTEESTTAIVTTPLPVKFVCTRPGRYPNPSQSDCSTYKYCLLTAIDTLLEYTFKCPTGYQFNPTESRCTSNYECPIRDEIESTSTTTTTTTTEPPSVSNPTFFYCTADGRFPDPSSVICETYVMCLKTATGSLLQYIFRCPTGSFFNPNERKCSLGYQCS